MPWFNKSDNSTSDYSNPSSKETCQLLWAYNQDISKAKFFFAKIAPHSPARIPSAQWEQMFKGDPIDLNQIFASLHHVIPDKERMGCLGDMEIMFGVSESKKCITTASEWHLLGEEHQKPLVSPSHIERMNSLNMDTALKVSLWTNSSLHTTKSCSMMLSSRTRLQEANTPYSPTFTNSPDSIPPSSYQMVSNLTQNNWTLGDQPHIKTTTTNLKYATSSTSEPVKTQTQTASTNTFARTVTNLVIPKKSAHLGLHEIHGLQPKYLHHSLWKDMPSLSPTTAEWSETVHPLPYPPFKEISNPIALKTITDHPTIQVRTPIKIEVFQLLLKHHPNPDFINSVCMGLHEGFWPWADTLHDDFPTMHDESQPMPANQKHATFLHDQCLKECLKGHFSPSVRVTAVWLAETSRRP